MDRFVTTTRGKANILLFATSLNLVGIVLVFLGNFMALMDSDRSSEPFHNVTNSSDPVYLGKENVTSAKNIPTYAIITIAGYVFLDQGYDSSNCFLKTFALACVPVEDHPGIIVKQILASSFGKLIALI